MKPFDDAPGTSSRSHKVLPMLSISQANPTSTIDQALTGQRAQKFYQAVLAIIKVVVLLIAHLLGLAATALQALSKYYKEECHEGLIEWAKSTPADETSTETTLPAVINQVGLAKPNDASQQVQVKACAPVTVSYQGCNSKVLKQLCKEFGVQWRNAHGQGRHLKVQEMKTRIDQAAIASSKR